MSKKIHLNVKLFGCLSKYATVGPLILTATQGSSITVIKQKLIDSLTDLTANFQDHEVIRVSAIAHAESLLPSDFKFLSSGDIFVLPPVCGG